MEQSMKGVQFFDDLIAKVLRYLAINRVLNCQALPIVSQFHDLQSINVRLKSSTLEKKHTYKKKKATQEVVHLHGAGSGEGLFKSFSLLRLLHLPLQRNSPTSWSRARRTRATANWAPWWGHRGTSCSSPPRCCSAETYHDRWCSRPALRWPCCAAADSSIWRASLRRQRRHCADAASERQRH